MSERQTVEFAGRGALSIYGTTAWNALATSPYRTWALRRAEVSGCRKSPFHCLNGEQATMAFIRSLPPTSIGGERLLTIARRCVAPLVDASRAFGPRVGIVAGLPERYDSEGPRGRFRRERAELDAAFRSLVGEQGAVRFEPLGNAALAGALLRANELLSSGLVESVIVGGVDTPYDPDHVETLVREERLFDGENLDASIPGEGGAFLLVGPANRVLAPIAHLVGAAAESESGHQENDVPCMATGLSRAMRSAVAPLRRSGMKVDVVYTDMTHEIYRSQEFQLAFPRLSMDMRPQSRLEMLPPLLGDLGAATMATGVAIGTEAFLRGDPPGQTALVTGSSVGPGRGAVCFAAA